MTEGALVLDNLQNCEYFEGSSKKLGFKQNGESFYYDSNHNIYYISVFVFFYLKTFYYLSFCLFVYMTVCISDQSSKEGLLSVLFQLYRCQRYSVGAKRLIQARLPRRKVRQLMCMPFNLPLCFFFFFSLFVNIVA